MMSEEQYDATKMYKKADIIVLLQKMLGKTVTEKMSRKFKQIEDKENQSQEVVGDMSLKRSYSDAEQSK